MRLYSQPLDDIRSFDFEGITSREDTISLSAPCKILDAINMALLCLQN